MLIVYNGSFKVKTEPEKCAYLMFWLGDKGRIFFDKWNRHEEKIGKAKCLQEKNV